MCLINRNRYVIHVYYGNSVTKVYYDRPGSIALCTSCSRANDLQVCHNMFKNGIIMKEHLIMGDPQGLLAISLYFPCSDCTFS